MHFLAVIVGVALSMPLLVFAQASSEDSPATYAVDQLTQLLLNLRQPTADEILRAFSVPESSGIAERLDLLLKNPALALLIESVSTSTATTTNESAATTAATDPETAALTAEIQAVQAEISALLGAGGGSATTTGSGNATSPVIACPIIDQTLSFGSTGTDVTNLQIFLIAESLLEAGNATGFFGPLTQAAVQAWQAAKGIVSDGSPETTGWGVVGPRTRAALQNCR